MFETVHAERLLLAALIAVSLLGACGPEAERTRSGGPGADVGNRTLGPSVELHGPTDPLFEQPAAGKAVEEMR